MTETKVGIITKERHRKEGQKQNLWKMFRRKKGTSTSQMSKLHKQNAKNSLGNV